MSQAGPERLFGETGGQGFLLRYIDHMETYGPHIIERVVGSLKEIKVAADLGAGGGRDLATIKRLHPGCQTVAVDANVRTSRGLTATIDRVVIANLERDRLPFGDGEVDFFLSNTVFESIKEIFWVFHEVFRCMPVGGHFLLGVRNICSLHNRLLVLAGRHPTQVKLCSNSFRAFSIPDMKNFLAACVPGGYEIVEIAGSQFYPFPRKIARPLATAFPGLAFKLYFMIKKTAPYTDSFATYPARAHFEANFWSGESYLGSQ